MNSHENEIAVGKRFEFGKNWQRFLSVLNDERIAVAEQSLKRMLKTDNLEGKRFLDTGSGSGLFSLVARRLGATVHSFDYDPQSVACTQELKRRYFPNDPQWQVESGPILDTAYLSKLGTFDIVYSWGVLHHTGAMWQALENTQMLVAKNGFLYIAIYNHQVYWSAFNIRMKRLYVRSPVVGKWFITISFIAFQVFKGLIKDLIFLRNPLQRYKDKKTSRGMSTWHDWIDWIGGYPFEVAKPEDIFHFYRDNGFILMELKTCGGGHGYNEYVFQAVTI